MSADKTIYVTRPAIYKNARVERGKKIVTDPETAAHLLATGRFSTEPPAAEEKKPAAPAK